MIRYDPPSIITCPMAFLENSDVLSTKIWSPKFKIPGPPLLKNIPKKIFFGGSASLSHLFLGLEVCSDIDQFEDYENINNILAGRDKDTIETVTECLYPCTYHEYEVSRYYRNEIFSL